MVDAEDAAVVGRAQAVAALAVGVVDHDVERGHAPELVGVLREQREVVLLGIVVHEPLHHPDARRDRRAARCRGRSPNPALPTPRVPRPRGCTACRAGSPTAGARRAAACRSRAARRQSIDSDTRNVAFDDHGIRPSTSTSPSRSSDARGRRRRPARPAGQPDPSDSPRVRSVHPRADVPVGVHREVAQRALGPARGHRDDAVGEHGPDLRARRVEARDVTFALFDRGRRLLRLRRPARAARCSTSDRSGSKPMPISRARNSGSSSSTRAAAGQLAERAGLLRVLLGDAVEELLGLGREQLRPAPSRRAPTASPRPCAPGSRTCARRAGRTRPRRSRRPDRTRSRRLCVADGAGSVGLRPRAARSSRPPVSLHFTSSAP